jgi:putative addiction module component (TIGR02574 family)
MRCRASWRRSGEALRSGQRGIILLGSHMVSTMNKALLNELMQLSPADRIELAYELWDSIPADSTDFQLTPDQQQEIERRMAEHERDPSRAMTLEQFEARLRSRFG